MAIIYRAELSPSKLEVLRGFLADRSWGEPADPVGEEGLDPLQVIGAYRFDDPDGEVGIECHLVAVDDMVYHLPLTYRPQPIEHGDAHLISTMQHSVLGQRYVYDGLTDELALDCFRRALSGEQAQAPLEIYGTDGVLLETRPQTVRLTLEVDAGAEPPTAEELLGGEPFTIARTVGGLDAAVRLVASWDGGSGVVAGF